MLDFLRPPPLYQFLGCRLSYQLYTLCRKAHLTENHCMVQILWARNINEFLWKTVFFIVLSYFSIHVLIRHTFIILLIISEIFFPTSCKCSNWGNTAEGLSVFCYFWKHMKSTTVIIFMWVLLSITLKLRIYSYTPTKNICFKRLAITRNIYQILIKVIANGFFEQVWKIVLELVSTTEQR